MRFRICYMMLLVAVAATTVVVAFCDAGKLWTVGLCGLMVVLVLLLYRSVAIPMKAVRNGLNLLREQDFSSRLRLTGQPDADNIVELYNTLMASMKAERLKNLEQNRFLSLVVEASPLGIAVCDFNGAVVRTNSAWERMSSPELAKAVESVADGDSQVMRLPGASIVRISKLWFMDSGFRRRFVIVERITEEITAAEKQMFNIIVRTIGHEVNNSLGSVISILESLGAMHSDDSLAAPAIDSCTTSCVNLVSFVRGYAEIVKLPPPDCETVDVNRWLTGLGPALTAMTPANVSLEIDSAPADATACFDPVLMERVVVNIVKNAVESIAERPDGAIEIALRSDPLTLTVTDNGPGIADEVSAKLFTPFFSTKRPDRGLGLMLVADILRAHGFRYSLSTSPDTGLTTFAIILSPKR